MDPTPDHGEKSYRDERFCESLVKEAVQTLDGLDIVVCNAARQQSRASILDITSEDFDATMKTHIYAPEPIDGQGRTELCRGPRIFHSEHPL